MNYDEFLRFLTQAPGIQVVVGAFYEWLSEANPGFQALDKHQKQLAFAGLCFGLPMLGCILGIFTAGWAPTIRDTLWPALAAGFTAFTSGTLWHSGKQLLEA